jgi:hypothetical protein
VISSLYEFTDVLKKRFYPLGYIQQTIMDWKNLRQGREHNVQDYTHEFRKRELILGIPIHTQNTHLKYIGGLHGYLRHTILMFNPTNFNEVCVQAIDIESREKDVHDNISKKIV